MGKKQNVDKEKDMEDRTWYDIFHLLRSPETRKAYWCTVRGGGGAS